jgi:hypothetical protein
MSGRGERKMTKQSVILKENDKEASPSYNKEYESVLSKQTPIQDTEEPSGSPERPSTVCNDEVKIIKHEIHRKDEGSGGKRSIDIEFTVKNTSDTVFGSVLFEAVLYDEQGEILDTIEQKTIELKPGLPRVLHITYSGYDSKKVNSYLIRVVKTALIRKPVATGDKRIKILYHTHLVAVEGFEKKESRIGIGIRNISDDAIASIIFQAVFYDAEGNILTTMKHKEGCLGPKKSRAIFIVYPDMQTYDSVKSYNVKIVRTATTEMEKVQIRQCNLSTTDAGEKIEGNVKNISAEKTDVALIANFYNYQLEKIGCKVLILRNIEANSARRFDLLFNPYEGENVKTFSIGFGELTE